MTRTSPTPARAPQQRRRPPEPDMERPRTVVVAVRKLFDAETPEYFMLLGTTLFLVVFGLIMVLSSSSIEARAGVVAFAPLMKTATAPVLSTEACFLMLKETGRSRRTRSYPAKGSNCRLRTYAAMPHGSGSPCAPARPAGRSRRIVPRR